MTDEERKKLIEDSVDYTFFADLNQDLIVTTEDKLRIKLTTHLNILSKKQTWLTPFSLFFTVIVVFVTSEFKEAIISADSWKAVFIMLGFASFIWLIWSLKYAFTRESIDTLISKIKNKENE